MSGDGERSIRRLRPGDGGLLDEEVAGAVRRHARAIVSGALLITALTAWRIGWDPGRLAPYVVFGALAVLLSVVDVAIRRLPDVFVVTGTALLSLLIAAAGPWPAVLRAVAAAAALGVGNLVIALATGKLGLGDVKVSVPIGLATGWIGWAAVVAGLVYAYFGLALCALVLIGVRRRSGKTRVAFGPYLLGGGYLAMLMFG